jgi:hypothetical protein
VDAARREFGRGARGIPRKTNNPERALRNLLVRDRMFADRLVDETRRLGLPVIEVDQRLSEEELAERVARLFGL